MRAKRTGRKGFNETYVLRISWANWVKGSIPIKYIGQNIRFEKSGKHFNSNLGNKITRIEIFCF